MRRWGWAYLGRCRFPKDVSDFELLRAFTFSDRERRDIRRVFRVRYRLAAALQLGFLRLTGTALASVAYVPTVVLHHLGRQFRGPTPDLATLRALYRRRQTRFEHRRWAIEYLGLCRLDGRGDAALTEELRQRTHGTLSHSRLEQHARDWLQGRSYLIPGPRRIAQRVRQVVQAIEADDHRELRRAMTAEQLQRILEKLLAPRAGGAMTAVEWLRRPPKRRSLRTMRELHDKYRWLELLVGHYRLSGIPRQRQLVYARRFRRRRAADLGTLSDHRRELEALCFITVTLATITDDLLRLVEMRITAIWRWAHGVAADRVPGRGVRVVSSGSV